MENMYKHDEQISKTSEVGLLVLVDQQSKQKYDRAPKVGHMNIKSIVTRAMELTIEEVLILDNMPWHDVVRQVEGELHKDDKPKAFIVRTYEFLSRPFSVPEIE